MASKLTAESSVSTLDDPMPAFYAALGLYAVMWTGWFFIAAIG